MKVIIIMNIAAEISARRLSFHIKLRDYPVPDDFSSLTSSKWVNITMVFN